MSIGKRIKKRREDLGMTQEELANKIGYKSRSTINKKEHDYIDYTDKILSIQNKIKKLLDLYLDGDLDKELYNSKKEKLDNDLDKFLQLQADEDRKKESEVDYKRIVNTIKTDWEHMDNIQKNQIMKLLITDIIVSNDDIQINWAF